MKRFSNVRYTRLFRDLRARIFVKNRKKRGLSSVKKNIFIRRDFRGLPLRTSHVRPMALNPYTLVHVYTCTWKPLYPTYGTRNKNEGKKKPPGPVKCARNDFLGIFTEPIFRIVYR